MAFSFDRFSRSREHLLAYFEHFGEVECPQVDGEIYRELCRVVRNDEDLLGMAAKAPATQPPANLLFGAVHYLLLGGEVDPLEHWYPSLVGREANPPDTIGGPFRQFCMRYQDRIEALIRTRLTQTNVVQRCSSLLPAFATVFKEGGERSLSLIEIGASAGLNMQWDRYFYLYDGGQSWGDPNSRVRIECELHGETGLPTLAEPIPVAWRRGVDLKPVDVEDPDQVLWLRSLVWPDHVGRQERLTSAIAIARENQPVIIDGDASIKLPALLAEAPPDTTLCVYGTHTLYQFPREALITTLKAMQLASHERPIHFFSVEGTSDHFSELRWTIYDQGKRSVRLIAKCNPHGRWLQWLPATRRIESFE